MSKSSTHNHRKPGPIHFNKAELQRQQKAKKVEDSNRKVTKQLDKSADSWQNSMDQIRRIAKKSHDSSQIIDNVFTENENDRSEMDESLLPHQTQSASLQPPAQLYSSRPHGMMEPLQYRPTSHQGLFQSAPHNFLPRSFPQSAYANSSPYYNQNPRAPDLNMSQFYHPRITPTGVPSALLNLNQSNCGGGGGYAYPAVSSTPLPKYYNPPSFQRPSFLSQWQPHPHPGIMLPRQYASPYARTAPPPYPYPYYGTPQPPPPQQNNSLDSMKRYVASLLEKLELLNETVTQMKMRSLTPGPSATCRRHHAWPEPQYTPCYHPNSHQPPQPPPPPHQHPHSHQHPHQHRPFSSASLPRGPMPHHYRNFSMPRHHNNSGSHSSPNPHALCTSTRAACHPCIRPPMQHLPSRRDLPSPSHHTRSNSPIDLHTVSM